ncbi:MAG: tRNA pseudouridine(38-40) synthase TruA [Muribaculaceae bacterium]|nr:tRNA pseudouridine(38-40) synthase TruA [Muribaculaceae bacterium]
MRWFMTLGYRGAPYHGWQVQPGQTTVQGELERALSTLLRTPVAVTGAGRTDSGVNAHCMVAHFDTDEATDASSAAFVRSLNSLIGYDIAVYDIVAVKADAHARFDATERSYRYYATSRKNPFARGLAWKCSPALDFDAMNAAASLLIGRRDFTSFAKLHSDAKTNICDLRRAAWHRMDGDSWYFDIAADRFLRNMVRAVVGTLVDVGRGKMRPEEILDVLDKNDRCAAGTSMPAEALYLWSVDYPKEIFI